MINKDAQTSLEVVTYIIQFHSQPIRALIDLGATYFFLFLLLLLIYWAYLLARYNLICLSLRQLGNPFWLPEWLRMIVLCLGVEEHVDLILFQLHDFDIILGIDWLATHHALVDCFAKRVTFQILGQPKFCFEGSSSDTLFQLISIMKA